MNKSELVSLSSVASQCGISSTELMETVNILGKKVNPTPSHIIAEQLKIEIARIGNE